MQALTRATKEVVKASTRGFASGTYPDRKVAVLGAAGKAQAEGSRVACVPTPGDFGVAAGV